MLSTIIMGFLYYFLILFAFFFHFSCNKEEPKKIPPKAVKGVLDLRGSKPNVEGEETFLRLQHLGPWDFATDGSINLDGEWEFYWGEFVEPHLNGDGNPNEGAKTLSRLHLDSPNTNNDPIQNSKFKTCNEPAECVPNYLTVPGNWNNFLVDEKPVGGQGYATYRLRVLLPTPVGDANLRHLQEERLAIKTLTQSSSYRMYVNGELLTEVGKAGKSKEESSPAYFPQVIPLKKPSGVYDIVFHVSNFEHRDGGLWDKIRFGTEKELTRERENNLLLDLFLFGALFLMGLYHFGLFSLRRKDSSTFYFGLFCLLMAIRTVLTGEYFLYQKIPHFPWEIGLKLEYLTLYLGAPIFLQFVYLILPEDMPPRMRKALLFLSGFLSLIVIFFPPIYFTATLQAMQGIALLCIFTVIYTMVVSIYKRRLGAKSFFSGAIFFTLIIINDLLYSNRIIQTGFYTPYGFLIFVFSQSFVLSMRFARAFSQVEDFSKNLEIKISEGVKEQQKFSQCLLELSKSKTITERGLEPAIKEVTEICARTLEIGRCSIWISNPKMDTLECLDLFIGNENKHDKSKSFTSSEFKEYFQYLTENDFLSADNVYSHPGIMGFNESYHEIYNIQSALDAPIRSGGRLLGVISCEQVTIQKEWSTEEENFVSSLANILAGYFEAKERQEAHAELIETKKEIEDLNTFSHLINSLSDLNSIFIEISKYFHHTFGISGVWLHLPNEKKEYLYAYKAYSYNKLSEDKYHYLMNKKIPLVEREGGIVFKTFQRKKPFYLGKIPKFEFEIDKEIVEKLSLNSFLEVPLVRKEECVGVFSFSNFEKDMKLSKSDIHKISNLCYQIAGAIDTNNSLLQVDKSRRETEALNEISKSVNSNLNIKGILDLAMGFVNNNFGIDFCALYLVDKQKNIIRITYLSKIIKDHLTLSDLEISKSEFSLEKIDHALGYVYQTKETIYTKELIEPTNETEKKLIDFIKLKSSLLVPLLLKKEVIGILGFSNYDRVMDLKEIEITTLEKIADQLTGAIYNSNLLEETQKARAQADLARIDAEIERGISVIAKLEVEKAKKKTEDLNLLIKKVNETSDLQEIMKIILSYVKDNYNLPYYSLFTLDPKENVLKFANAVVPDHVTPEHKKMISSSVLSLESKNIESIHSRALILKSPIFIPDAEAEVKTESGKAILKAFKHKSILTLPIILQNNPIGTLDFFSLEPLRLREEEITELSLLAEQLAGVIYGATLFTQVQEEKEKALAAQKETEKQKKETEGLNQLIKSLNEDLNIQSIMQKVHSYIKTNYNIHYYGLAVVDKDKEFAITVDTLSPDFISSADRERISNFATRVKDVVGAHALAFKSKKPFFAPRIRKSGMTEEEIYNQEVTKLESILIIPLILQNEPIGFLDLYKVGKMELSKEDITKLSILGEQLAGIIHGSNLFKQVQEEKEKAIVAQKETEKQKQEIETIAEYSKKLNSRLNLDTILDDIFAYFNERYNLEGIIVQFLDKEKNEFYTYKTTAPENASQEMIDYSRNLKLPYDARLGILYSAYQKSRTLYAPRIVLNLQTPVIQDMIIALKFQSFLFVPLIIQDEVIGSMFFTSYRGKINLTKSDISNISIFCNQISSSLQNSKLFGVVQEEKEKALVAQLESEKSKAQIEFLNEFSKVINSFNNLDIIFSHAVENLSNKIETDIFQLQLVDKAKNELFTRCISGTDSGLMKKYNKLRVPLIPESGSLYLAYASKKTLYLKKIQRIAENKKSELDKMVEKDFQIDSVFQIPLLVNEEVIGIMSINKSGGMKKLSKDEIRFVESLCEQLALAVNNSFLLEAAKSERQKSEKLLLNILPKDVASELKEKGFAEPVLFENVSVMFTDFKGFTTIAEKLTPQELIKDLDACFVQFDKISERFNLEKLKTIGDSYMCAGGIPKRNKTHAIDCCLAALEIQSFMNLMKKLKEEQGYPYWELRLGIHTGPLIAGVIGERKFAYDVWGDTVNTASRMESSGTPGRINISYSTYEVVKDFFVCEYRGEVSAKNKGVVKMYYLDRIKPEFSKDEEGLMPNGKFWEMYG